MLLWNTCKSISKNFCMYSPVAFHLYGVRVLYKMHCLFLVMARTGALTIFWHAYFTWFWRHRSYDYFCSSVTIVTEVMGPVSPLSMFLIQIALIVLIEYWFWSWIQTECCCCCFTATGVLCSITLKTFKIILNDSANPNTWLAGRERTSSKISDVN